MSSALSSAADAASSGARQPAGNQQPKAPFDYQLFLSHNSRDKALVEALAEELLDKHEINCWVDVWAIPAAADWRRAIDAALDSCGGALIALGEHGFGPVHAAEATRAIERSETGGFSVIPLVFATGTQTVQEVIELARARSAPGVDLTALFELFESKNCIRCATDLDDQQRQAALSKLSSALGDSGRPPHPLGPDTLTPIRIRRDARLWETSGRKSDHLYGEDKARVATVQRLRSPGQLDDTALAFLDAATEHHRAVRRRRSRMLTVAVAVLAALLAVAAVLAVLAYLARRDSDRALRAALGRRASLFAQTGDERGALTDGLQGVLPSLSDGELSDDGFQGLWRAVAAARGSFSFDGTCSPNLPPSLSADGSTAFYLTREGVPTRVSTDWYEQQPLDVGKRSASAIAMSADGAHYWVGAATGELLAASASSFHAVVVGKPCSSRVLALADAPPGQLVVACENRDLVTYEVTAAGIRELSRRETVAGVISMTSNPRYVLVVGAAESVLVDRASGAAAEKPPIMLAGAISKYDQVVGIDVQRAISRCELHAGSCVPLPPARFPDASFEAVAFTGAGEWIVGGDGVGRLLVWAARGGDFRVVRSTAHAYPIAQLALSADGSRALSVDISGACRAWRSDEDAARSILGKRRVDSLRPPWLETARLGSQVSHVEPTSVLAVAALKGDPMSLHTDGSVRLWRRGTPSLQWSVAPITSGESACLGLDAAGVVREGNVVVESKGKGRVLAGEWAALSALHCRIEQRTLRVTGLDGLDHFFDLDSGKAVERTSARSPSRISAAERRVAPPTGVDESGASSWRLPGTDRRLMISSDARFWLRLESSWIELEYRKLTPEVTFASSPDHRLLAAGNDLGEIWVWRVDDGSKVIQLAGSSEPITSLEWDESGDLLAGSLDGAVRIYSASAKGLVREACRLVRPVPQDRVNDCKEVSYDR